MANITSKIDCFIGRYYGSMPSFSMDDDYGWHREKFNSLEEAIRFVDNEEDAEVFVGDETVYKDGKLVADEETIRQLVEETEAAYVRWLREELERMLK